LMISIDD